MGVLGEAWCFCNGGGKSERMKGNIFSSKGPAMAKICNGSGFLIHRNLLLTTHVNLPSVTAAEGEEIRLQDSVVARLFPHRFFITSSILDLTIVGLDTVDGDSNSQGQQPHFLKTCSNPSLDLGSVVYLLGYTEKKELTVGEGKVVIATDNLIKLSTDGVIWSPGSAGFDLQGNLAFMVCDPMKLSTSPATKSSSTSSSSASSSKKDLPMQFGIPIPIICDWLNQHWEGSLDDLNKPKLPIIRLMSSGHKSDQSCPSFTLRRVFKSIEGENIDTPSSSHLILGHKNQPGPNTCQEETLVDNPRSSIHEQGIPTPEIYDSPRLNAGPIRRKEKTPIQLLNINFPPRALKPMDTSIMPIKRIPRGFDENGVEERASNPLRVEDGMVDRGPTTGVRDDEIGSTGSVNGGQSEVQSSSSPVKVSEFRNERRGFHGDYSSEGETMYSAETAESRNYSPRERKFQEVGRSQSCVSYTRRNPVVKQNSFSQGRKVYSQGSQRGHDYHSPTVASIMKKRNNSEQLRKPRESAVHLSPRWNF